MDNRARPALSEEVAAAIDWWRDAGVDFDFQDAPARWLAEQVPAGKAPVSQDAIDTAIPSPRDGRGAMGIDHSSPIADHAAIKAIWPSELADFASWWLAEPALDNGRIAGRVPPRGPAGAQLMVIVAEPERDDTDRLLSGPQGAIVAAMLAAMGIADDAIYVASVLPRHTPMADWDEAERGFAGILRHHVTLVHPDRLIVLGANILPLLGHDPAHSPAVLRSFNHEGLTIPLLAGKSPAALLERPRWKAGLWQGWLDWTRPD